MDRVCFCSDWFVVEYKMIINALLSMLLVVVLGYGFAIWLLLRMNGEDPHV